jgi:glycosyltransferase involved in cell wall biosynthesis
MVSAAKVLYWIVNYMPQWEAVSKEVASLREGLQGTVEGSVLGLNNKERGFQLRGQEKRIPIPHGLPLYPLMKPYASRFDINHLFASGGERFITPIISRYNGVLTIAKDTSLRRFDRNRELLLRLQAIVVQGERDRELLLQMGVRREAICLIRPGVPVSPYRKAEGPFTILFASSPLTATDFLSRGIYLMLQVAGLLPEVRFLLIWRKRHLTKLKHIVAAAGIHNVVINSGLIRNMGEMYDTVHASVLPGLEHRSFIPCPRSGLESLAHGKPLLVSNLVSLATAVAHSRAGVAFDPSAAGLKAAILRLQKDYSTYQANTQQYVRDKFSPSTHLELYRRLYQRVA